MSRILAAIAIAALGSASFAGPLDPPAGPVGPSMKSLDEVEPSIPIGPETTPGDENSLFKITTPGNYHLTGNVLVGTEGLYAIEVEAGSVTIDLRGSQVFTANVSQIASIKSQRGVHVNNGTVLPTQNQGIALDLGSADGTYGVRVEGRRNMIFRNQASDNGDNYSVVTSSANFWGDKAAPGGTMNNPNVNYGG